MTSKKKNTAIPLTQSHAFDKPFVDYKFQLKRLKDRGLSIPDSQIEVVTSLIKQHGYYQIINGYGSLFEQNGTKYKHYIPGTSFEDIYTQFNIDRQLGKILLTYLLDIEDHFSNILSYTTAEHFDVNNFYKDDPKNPDSSVLSYLNYTHFPNGPSKVLGQLHELSLTCKDYPTCWYITHKNHVPSWVLFMNAELGTLNRYYKICPSSVKREINDAFLPSPYSLNSFLNLEERNNHSNKTHTQLLNAAKSMRGKFIYSGLELMREFRNCIAHNSRLLAFESRTTLSIAVRNASNISPSKLYTNHEYYDGTGKNDLFALFLWILICQTSEEARLVFIESIREFFLGSNVNKAAMNLFLRGTKLPSNFILRLNNLSNVL
ncbi:Abi family protein [Lactiplantibacillus plantarum]|uniref:Abi family protein n=1 Tax=Lactiplantibacillus plantarum TaxID=1590 RepID=UPI0028FC13EF|nr:Abi family protein [Lactiplantibacillus plantarum]WNW16689.1 Abi family protein [Lactiplantibacillus plantarum]WNW19663.1 Abi family protein [Lactiplantibacillus plantarum]